MTDKQAVAQLLNGLPEDVPLAQIAEAFWRLAIERDDKVAFGAFYRSGLTDEDLQEYMNPQFDVNARDLLRELEADAAAYRKPPVRDVA